LALAFGMMFLTLGLLPAYAVDLNAELSSKGVPEKPAFRFVETAFVDYHNGGTLRDVFSGKNTTISFTANSSNPSVRDLVGRINTYLSQDLKNSTRVTDLFVDYHASLVGTNNTATIDYSLTLVPTISNYIVTKYSDDTTIIDAAWIGMSLDGPVVIKTVPYGDVDVGNLAGLVHQVTPNLEITDSHVKQLLNSDLIDSSSLVQQPISDWQHLFDPAYIITETSGWGYNGSKIAITTLTVGESRIGVVQNNQINTADFTIDKNYEIQTVQHASSATIQVDGQAILAVLGTKMAITTTPQSTNANPLPSTGLSVQMIYAMAGFGVVIALGIFLWSNKKMKDSLKREKDTGHDPVFKYEERKHWADRFDDKKS
ncbi:MAG: hypothetical protein ACREAT_00740, partial [Nitrosotalea sp.]